MSKTFLWFKTKEPKKTKEKVPKYISPIGKRKNKRGFSFIALFELVFGLAVLAAFVPMIMSLVGINKASNSLNCPGYVDTASTVLSYNASLPSEIIPCTVMNSTVGLTVLGVVGVLIFAVIVGRGMQPGGA